MANYIIVTEMPENKASQEQFDRLFNRYHFAGQYSQAKDVLEVACGSGIGLGYLAQKAKKVVGGDIDEEILKYPRQYYKEREKVEIKSFDACQMPFEDNSFDVVIFYEAIYYLENAQKFFEETQRVLRAGGVLIISTVNKNWADFNPSPFSHKYYGVPELFNLFKENNFGDIKFFGDSPIFKKTAKDKIISLIKRLAVKFHLMPRTMKGKALFKRIFFGQLKSLPQEIKEGMAEYTPPASISHSEPNHQYKVLFAVAHK